MPLLIPVFVLLLVALLLVAISRGNELFLLSIREGRVLLVRGRIPLLLLQDIEDVVERARLSDGVIRAVRSAGHSRLILSGIEEPSAQRLRNVFGVHPIQRLMKAPNPANRNIGQVLGITALAWFFSRPR